MSYSFSIFPSNVANEDKVCLIFTVRGKERRNPQITQQMPSLLQYFTKKSKILQ